jgi:hypothetical protein
VLELVRFFAAILSSRQVPHLCDGYMCRPARIYSISFIALFIDIKLQVVSPTQFDPKSLKITWAGTTESEVTME